MATGKVLLAVLAVLVFDGLGVQVASAPAQGSSPTALQLIQSELISLPHWNHYLPDDIDTNNDGELSEEEVGEKVKSYMSEVFNQLDKNSNQVVIQDEVKNASLDVDFLNKIVDIAFKSYPIKTYLGHGDRNQDGFISEDDFYLADHSQKMKLEDAQEHCGGDCESMSYDYDNFGNYNKEEWTMSSSFPMVYVNSDYNPVCAESFGEKEADVLCREMRFKGVESLSSVSFDEYKETASERDVSRYFEPYKSKFDCQGSESKLEECSKSEVDDSEYYYSRKDNCPFGKNHLLSVTCVLDTEIGPLHLAGGKVPSVGELHIGDKVYRGETMPEMAQVVCRELGFNQGTPKIIRSSIFSNYYIPKFDRTFECTGFEAKLSDCRQTLMSPGYDYWRWYNYGIDCNPGEDLDEKYGRIDQRIFIREWEFWGRRLLFADTNGDEQVSMEELKAKSKEILEAVFHLLDQTNDGSLSVEDVSTLSLSLPDVTDVLNKLFEFITGGKEEFDPFAIGMFNAQDEMDTDSNGRLTLNEITPHLDSSQDEGLLLLLSKYLDTNQDGLLQSDELENYLKMIFNNLDVDDSSTITLDDVFKFMKKSQFTCLQIEGVETFVEGWMELIGTQAGKLLEYFFTYLDLDSNGEISLDEFYNLPVCNQMDSNDPHACRNLEAFFYFDQRPVVPNLKYTGRGLYLQRDGKDVQEKLANSLCMAMQPDF